jgi:hypothetical protein
VEPSVVYWQALTGVSASVSVALIVGAEDVYVPVSGLTVTVPTVGAVVSTVRATALPLPVPPALVARILMNRNPLNPVGLAVQV